MWHLHRCVRVCVFVYYTHTYSTNLMICMEVVTLVSVRVPRRCRLSRAVNPVLLTAAPLSVHMLQIHLGAFKHSYNNF